MLIEPQRGRDLQVAIFEGASATALEDDLNEWFEGRDEETVVGLEIETDGTSFFAYVLFTE